MCVGVSGRLLVTFPHGGVGCLATLLKEIGCISSQSANVASLCRTLDVKHTNWTSDINKYMIIRILSDVFCV